MGARKFALAALISLSCCIFTGCKATALSIHSIHPDLQETKAQVSAPQTQADQDQKLLSELGLVLDPELTQEERRAVLADLERAKALELHGEPGSYFEKVFGATDNSGVMTYFSERVHYILPRSLSLDGRITQDNFHPYTYATNIGTMLWFDALASAPKPYSFKVGKQTIPVTSSRVGLVQLGVGYTVQDPDPVASSQIQRIATLVHEARHSDCTGGISSSDLELLQEGEDPVKSNCGHLHVRCPEGHTYDGAYACDDEAWGAYSIEATYLSGIIKNCPNCTAEEKSVAAVIYADSLDRVIPKQDMLAGKLGDPDMSSSTKVTSNSPFAPTLH